MMKRYKISLEKIIAAWTSRLVIKTEYRGAIQRYID